MCVCQHFQCRLKGNLRIPGEVTFSACPAETKNSSVA